MQKCFEYFQCDKNNQILSLDYDAEYDLLVYGTNDRKICMVNDKGNFEIFNFDISPHVITSLLIEKGFRTLFAGTEEGNILVFIWPLQMKNNQLQYFTFSLHQKMVTKMLITADKQYFVSASEDCSIYMCQIKYYDESISVREDKLESQLDYLNSQSEDDHENHNPFPNVDGDATDLQIKELKSEQVLRISHFSLVSSEQMGRLKGEIKDLDFHIQNIKNETEDQNEQLRELHKKRQNEVESEKKEILKNQK